MTRRWYPPRLREPAEVTLTKRQAQMLSAICEGLNTEAIGKELWLSENTVKTHCRRLFRVLGVNNRAQAVAVAHQLTVHIDDWKL